MQIQRGEESPCVFEIPACCPSSTCSSASSSSSPQPIEYHSNDLILAKVLAEVLDDWLVQLPGFWTLGIQDQEEGAAADLLRVFWQPHAMKITIEDVFVIVAQKGEASHETLLYAVIYLIRMYNHHCNNPSFRMTVYNIERLLMACILLAHKFCDEDVFNNDVWAAMLPVSVKEMNLMELEAVNLVRFDLYVTREQYQQFMKEFVKYTPPAKLFPPHPEQEPLQPAPCPPLLPILNPNQDHLVVSNPPLFQQPPPPIEINN